MLLSVSNIINEFRNMARIPPANIIGQNISQQVMIDQEIRLNPQIQTFEEPYLLTKYKFSVLLKGDGWWKKLGETSLGGSIALLINMIGKLVGSKIDSNIVFDKWEVYAFILATAFTLLCYLIHRFVPDEQKRLIKEINAHFPQI